MQELRLEVHTPCNFNCRHCYTDKRPKGRLSDDDRLRLIREAGAMGMTDLSITGGEPLLNVDRVVRCIEEARSLGMASRLNTNGWFVDAAVLDRLATAGLTEMQISLDHSDPARFDAIRRHPGAFERVERAFRLLAGSPVRGVARYTIMSDNIDAICATYERVAEWGADGFKARSILEVGDVADPAYKATRAGLQAELDRLQAASERLGVPVNLAVNDDACVVPSPTVQQNHCKCGKDAVFVSASGDVFPCPFLREDPSCQVGDIHAGGLDEIVRSKGMADFIGKPEPGFSNDAGCRCKASQMANQTVQ